MAAVLLDCVKAFDSIDPARWPQGACAAPVYANHGSMPGCAHAMATLHVVLRKVVVTARSQQHVESRQAEDDLVINAVHESPQTTAQAVARAFREAVPQLAEIGLNVHPRKTVALATSKTTRPHLHRCLSEAPVLRVARTVRDLGFVVSSTGRATGVQARRLGKAKLCARPIAALNGVPGFRRNAVATQLLSGGAYGVEALGFASIHTAGSSVLVSLHPQYFPAAVANVVGWHTPQQYYSTRSGSCVRLGHSLPRLASCRPSPMGQQAGHSAVGPQWACRAVCCCS